MTRAEISLLLYLETCAVDHGGRVNMTCLSTDDLRTIECWKQSAFIAFGRIAFADVTVTATHWVTFSEEAWVAAHEERKARGLRAQENCTYQRISGPT